MLIPIILVIANDCNVTRPQMIWDYLEKLLSIHGFGIPLHN